MSRAILTAAIMVCGMAAEGSEHRAAPQANPLFMPAHEALLAKAKQGVIDLYFVGDSITRRWHATDYPAHQANWQANFFGWNAANFGWGGDTTHNVLWRMTNGELDDVHPKVIVLMVGTNNLGDKLPANGDEAKVEEVVGGIQAILDVFRQKAPEARIVLMDITPRGPAMMPTIEKINARIAILADGERIRFLSINDKLAGPEGQLHDRFTDDGLHLSTKGYQAWADALKPILTEWLGPPAKKDRAPPATGIPSVAP